MNWDYFLNSCLLIQSPVFISYDIPQSLKKISVTLYDMNKQGIVTAVAIVVFVAIGAVVLVAVALPLSRNSQDQSGTLQGLEQEQRGDVIPGNQPGNDAATATAEAPNASPATNGTTNNTTAASGQSTSNGSASGGSVASGNPTSPSDNPYSSLG